MRFATHHHFNIWSRGFLDRNILKSEIEDSDKGVALKVQNDDFEGLRKHVCRGLRKQ